MFNNYMNINRTSNLQDVPELYEKIDFKMFYRARVCDTHDPMKLGRVRIRIPSIHGTTKSKGTYIEDNSLPWAYPGVMFGAGNDMGNYIIPEKGTIVFVTFEAGDPAKPIYFGGVPTKFADGKEINDNIGVFEGKSQKVRSDDYITDIKNDSEKVIYKSFKGATIIIDDKDGKEYIKIIDQAGQQIIMQNDGESLNRRQDKTNPPPSASIKIVSNGKVEIDAETFKLNTKRNEFDIYDYDVKLNKEVDS